MSSEDSDQQSFSWYSNQVGGHLPFLRSSSGKVCKPLCLKELNFYETLSKRIPQLSRFTPRFYGLIELDAILPFLNLEESSSRADDASPASVSGSESDQRCIWSKRCHSKLNKAGLSVCKYIALEDLARSHTRPCILDVKMGRRQYIEGASPEKVQRQIHKSITTTSHCLGFRLCGLQVFNPLASAYSFRDKYWGRKVAFEDIDRAVSEFFFDGSRVRFSLIPFFIRRLQQLLAAVRSAIGFRFYSSSLLFLYDGDLQDDQLQENSVDIRMIDFANTIQVPDQSPDLDYVFGLENLINRLSIILSQEQQHLHVLPSDIPQVNIPPDYPPLPFLSSDPFHQTDSGSSSGSSSSSPAVSATAPNSSDGSFLASSSSSFSLESSHPSVSQTPCCSASASRHSSSSTVSQACSSHSSLNFQTLPSVSSP